MLSMQASGLPVIFLYVQPTIMLPSSSVTVILSEKPISVLSYFCFAAVFSSGKMS